MVVRTTRTETRNHPAAVSRRPLPGQDNSDDWYVGTLRWQDCQEELARPDLDPAWRAQVELRLEDICRGRG